MWDAVKLGDVCELRYGKPLPKDQRTDESGTPAYGANGIKTYAIESFGNGPTIIVGRKGSAGALKLVSEPFWPLDVTYFVVVDAERVDLEFLYHLLSAQNLPSMARGVKPGINRNDVYSIEVCLPPLPEQKRIVAKLDKAFAAIDKAIENTEKSLVNARELFVSALESKLASSGKDWSLRNMTELCCIDSVLVDPKEDKHRQKIHIGAGNIVEKSGVLVELKTAEEEGLISGKFAFDERMILYSKIRPYLEKVVRPAMSGLCSADIYPLLPYPELITKDYLYYMLRSRSFTDFAIAGSARAGMPKVNRTHLFSYNAAIPSVDEQEIICRVLDELEPMLLEVQSNYEKKINNLKLLKASILSGLLNEKSADIQRFSA
jgi:type I restriction enzyme, S subunit